MNENTEEVDIEIEEEFGTDRKQPASSENSLELQEMLSKVKKMNRNKRKAKRRKIRAQGGQAG